MTTRRPRKAVVGSVLGRRHPPDLPRAEAAVRDLLEALGFDPRDPALATTPSRVAEAFARGLTAGYEADPQAVLGAGFPVQHPNPVVALGIPLLFVCPHHLMPARGVVHLAFLPKDRVPGLSRITALVDALGRRLVLQEDLTQHLAETLMKGIGARAAVAVVEATHTCVAAEDLARRDAVFRTQATVGPKAAVAELVRQVEAGLASGGAAPRARKAKVGPGGA
ncbi:MAG: GTP cyclohydrolase I [Myxococcales bacterium]|nr:GTP cyclohydrolase I [Myxococcales bacterium]